MGFVIYDCDSLGIVKDRNGFWHAGAVLYIRQGIGNRLCVAGPYLNPLGRRVKTYTVEGQRNRGSAVSLTSGVSIQRWLGIKGATRLAWLWTSALRPTLSRSLRRSRGLSRNSFNRNCEKA
jgi:hypothetical protein